MLEFFTESILRSKSGHGIEWGPALTDDDLETISKIKHVAGIKTSSYNKITNEGLRYIAAMPELEILQLLGFEISDAGLAELEKSYSLKLLNIEAGIFSNEAIERFRSALPECEIVIDQPKE